MLDTAAMCYDHVQTQVGLLWTKVDSIAEDMEKLKLSVPQQASRAFVSAICTTFALF